MNAIVPLNIAAVRVSPTDSSNIVTQFKGRVASFDNMPWGQKSVLTSTGDAIVQLLESNDGPLNMLMTGIHLHWELPDYFRKGNQPTGGSKIVFPQVPNRWLVTRYLSLYDNGTHTWSKPASFSWVVESDYVSMSQLKDSDNIIRPSVPVPLPVNPAPGAQPYRYMGRVVNAANWPATAQGDQYLSDFKDENNQPYHLSSISFLGAGFSSYYPDCCSVFGFLDRFLDSPQVYNALKSISPLQFKVSYQVSGWIKNGSDPLDGMGDAVKQQYGDYVSTCKAQQVPVTQTPADFFQRMAQQQFKWLFDKNEIGFTCDENHNLTSLDVPGKTICSGILQEVVWNMLESPGTSSFLGDPTTKTSPGVWTDNDVKIAVGNTAVEALSALLKFDNNNNETNPDLLQNYEYLLDALQLGALNDLETQGNKVINLEETLHSNGFARDQGGLLWIVQQKPTDHLQQAKPSDPTTQITLPLTLAEQLCLLNQAQKDYDMGRSALGTMRKQLFMDWYRYVKMYAGGAVSSNGVTANMLSNYLTTPDASELSSVVSKGNSTGILGYSLAPDGSGAVMGVKLPDGISTTSLAGIVWTKLVALQKAMNDHPDWQVIAVPAPPFWLPADPVAVMEGSRIEPVRRNGSNSEITVRVTSQLINRLRIDSQNIDIRHRSSTYYISPGDIKGIPVPNSSLPYQQDFQTLAAEAAMLIPMLAFGIGDALNAKGGLVNFLMMNEALFVLNLMSIQGGVSGLEGGNPATGLFNMVRQPDYIAAANPQRQISGSLPIRITFTNTVGNGWLPHAVAWNTQLQYPEFSATRYDPFLPVSLIWNVTFDPLTKVGNANDYSSDNLTRYFNLDADAIDYRYNLNKLPFTNNHPGRYSSSVVLNKRPTYSLTYQIENYQANYPNDPAVSILSQIAANYKSRRIMSQTMSGLSTSQVLRSFIPQIAVEDLTLGRRDVVTSAIQQNALTGNPHDDWYDFAFNSLKPLTAGVFGPLRSGFLSVTGLEVVDVFGQRMILHTPALNSDNSLKVIPAMTVTPQPGDTLHATQVYLPPRILAPTRLWFRWLSATHNTEVSGISNDFVEMNTHPATSPVCGWVLPNHLDNNLFLYDAGGKAIGSFGIEHGNLKYRTRAGNIANPSDSLATDIGPQGQQANGINAHMAAFMWYINNRSGSGAGNGAFLSDFMQAILKSDSFINPANFAQDVSLSVLIGRPLAVTRAIISMETAGNLLPLNQSDAASTDPWPANIKSTDPNRFNYPYRMAAGAANLGGMRFPLRLGDLANIDDGLVGYIVEGSGNDAYANATFFSPAAGSGNHGVAAPQPGTIQLTLNTAPLVLTLLMDPRAAVHATTGVLPVEELSIPADQYSDTLASLQITFFTMPVLQQQQRLVVPLPAQNGYVWGWNSPGGSTETALKTNESNSNTNWGYTPQTLLEGWLKLSPDPNASGTNKSSKQS